MNVCMHVFQLPALSGRYPTDWSLFEVKLSYDPAFSSIGWSVSQLVCHNFLRANSFHALVILERLFLYLDNSQSVCLSVCPSVCMSVCLSICPSVPPSVGLLFNKNGSQIVVITTRPRFTMLPWKPYLPLLPSFLINKWTHYLVQLPKRNGVSEFTPEFMF